MIGKKLGEAFFESFHSSIIGQKMLPGPLELFTKEQAGKFVRMSEADGMGTIKNYFEGRNLSVGEDALQWGSADEALGKTRKYAAGGAAGLLTANAFGFDPFGATSGVNNLTQLGVNATIGTTMYGADSKKLKLAGLGYLAATVVNTFRDGDNLGPQ
jgi:hypothetical protein